MPIRVQCPSCSAIANLPDSVQGKAVKVTCKKCQTSFSLKPATGAEKAPSPAKATSPAKTPPPAKAPPKPRQKPTAELAFNDAAPGPRRRTAQAARDFNWLLIGGLGGGLGIAAAIGVLFLIMRLPADSSKNQALAPGAGAAPQEGQLPKLPVNAPPTIDPDIEDRKAFDALVELEKNEPNPDRMLAAYEKFWMEHPRAAKGLRKLIRNKIDVEFPQKIEARDYQVAQQQLEGHEYDFAKGREILKQFSVKHSNGPHAAEIQNLISGGLEAKAEEFAFTKTKKRVQAAGDDSDKAIALREYLQRHPNGKNNEEAQQMLGKINESLEARDYEKSVTQAKLPAANGKAIWDDFLVRFPAGRKVNDAKMWLQVHELRLLHQPPPALPPMPADVTWEKSKKEVIDRAILHYPADQVSACLTFALFRNTEKPRPTQKQKEWLERAVVVCKPRVMEVLRRDRLVAEITKDYRAAVMVAAASRTLNGNLGPEEQAFVTKLRNHVVSGQKIPAPIWKVSEVKADLLESPFTEGAFQNKVTLTPKAGFELIRLTGRVENMSDEFDPPYWSWTLSDLQRHTVQAFDDFNIGDKGPKMGRRAIDSFIMMLTPGGDTLPCAHVCQGCHELLGNIQIFVENSGTVGAGSFIERGAAFKMNVIFVVPENSRNLRLLVLGAEPVPFDFAKE